MRDLERYRRAIAGCEVVSFDVFDTLLVRSVAAPGDVFDLVAAEVEGHPFVARSEFRRLREAADAQANLGGVADLDDIYEELASLRVNDVEAYRLSEMEMERRVLGRNPLFADTFDEAKRMGKRIIVVSDMYVDSDFLKSVLAENGFDGIERIFVSCEMGATKRDGTLFPKALDELGIAASRVIHFGDSWKSDFLRPRAAGLKAVCIKPLIRSAGACSEASKAGSIALHAGRGADRSIGRAALAPLLLGFSQFLREKTKETQARPLFFLARDAHLLMRAFRLLYPDADCRYLEVSRRSIQFAMLADARTLADVRRILSPSRFISLGEFLSALGVSPEESNELAQNADLPVEEMLPSDAFYADVRVSGIFERILPDLRFRAEEQRGLLLEYLRGKGLEDGDCLVDVGWHASIQSMLMKLTGFELRGVYLGFDPHDQIGGSGYLFDATDESSMAREVLLSGFTGLVETLLTHISAGSAKGYSRIPSGGVTPVRKSPEIPEERLEVIRRIQSDAIGLLEGVKKIPEEFRPVVDREQAFDQLCRLGVTPRTGEITMLGALPVSDGERLGTLSGARPLLEYVLHPRSAAVDFFKSPWKFAWLREVSHLHINWAPLYLRLRRNVKRKSSEGVNS